MAKIFSWQFRVRSYEVNQAGTVSPAVFQNYLEETAIRASDAAGYDRAWYRQHNCSWVIRRMTVRYDMDACRDDVIDARSWVSDFRRVRSNREYDLRRASDQQRILRGRADWVFIDTEQRRPLRVLPEFQPAFEPDPTTAEDLSVSLATEITGSPDFEVERRVAVYEIDEMGHVNNANYFRWIEDAHWRVVQRLRLETTGRTVSHSMDFIQEAQAGDMVHITSRVEAVEGDYIGWLHEIKDARTMNIVARDRAVYNVGAEHIDQMLNIIVGQNL